MNGPAAVGLLCHGLFGTNRAPMVDADGKVIGIIAAYNWDQP
jgi:hypothetical protein